MAGLLDIAKDAGCLKVRCESCGKHTETSDVLRALFVAILERTREGEKVNIPGFGVFEARLLKGWKVRSPIIEMNGFFKDRLVLRFRSSVVAGRVLNQEREE